MDATSEAQLGYKGVYAEESKDAERSEEEDDADADSDEAAGLHDEGAPVHGHLRLLERGEPGVPHRLVQGGRLLNPLELVPVVPEGRVSADGPPALLEGVLDLVDSVEPVDAVAAVDVGAVADAHVEGVLGRDHLDAGAEALAFPP